MPYSRLETHQVTSFSSEFVLRSTIRKIEGQLNFQYISTIREKAGEEEINGSKFPRCSTLFLKVEMIEIVNFQLFWD
ncbi:hypothetical protein [Microcystis aeruginosa]|uniref:Uncharacterized protein n=1 Tax=Microcystis aeruginosa NIES-2521 TaxID=2303983 RepID=A0A5A5S475_MICAE|nr:hypothetical protein [Microcystis aeruginosa]GCA81965.1 hypothetical protein MiTs_03987 [Microcystis aeruginosa NIES-2521]